MVFLHKVKKIYWKSHPFIKEDEDYEENVKINLFDIVGVNKNLGGN